MKKYVFCGLCAGILNGFFGGGGGAILVPLFLGLGNLKQQEALASSVAIMFCLCLWSSFLYGYQGNLPYLTAIPYCIGGLLGGFLGGRYFPKVNSKVLKRGFSFLLILSGLRSIL